MILYYNTKIVILIYKTIFISKFLRNNMNAIEEYSSIIKPLNCRRNIVNSSKAILLGNVKVIFTST